MLQRLAIVSLMSGAVCVAGSDPVSALRRRGISQQQEAAIQKLDEESFRLNQEGNWREAIPVAEAFLAARREVFDESSFEVAVAKTRLGTALGLAGRAEEAVTLHRLALSDLEGGLGEEHADTNNVRSSLAGSYIQMGRYSDALKLHQQGLRISQEEHLQYVTVQRNVGGMLFKEAAYDEAMEIYEHVLDAQKRVAGTRHPHVGLRLSLIASIRVRQQDFDKARDLYRASIGNRLMNRSREHPDTIAARWNLASIELYAAREASGFAGSQTGCGTG